MAREFDYERFVDAKDTLAEMEIDEVDEPDDELGEEDDDEFDDLLDDPCDICGEDHFTEDCPDDYDEDDEFDDDLDD